MRGIADPSLTCLFVFGGGMDETVREGHGRSEAKVLRRNTSSLPTTFFLPPPPPSLWKGVFEGRRQNLLLPPFSPSLKFATDPVTPPPPPPRSVPSFFLPLLLRFFTSWEEGRRKVGFSVFPCTPLLVLAAHMLLGLREVRRWRSERRDYLTA